MKLLLACLLLVLSSPTWAVLYCITNAADFYTDLQTAATSSADDELRLASGLFGGLGSETASVNGDLRISGGWGTGCLARTISSLTTLTANSSADFTINMGGGTLEIDRLRFVSWNRVRILDSFTPALAEISSVTLHRSNFSALTRGLVAQLSSHDLYVSSSIFSGNDGDGLAIISPSGDVSGIKAVLQYNTFSANATGLRITTGIGPWASILVESSVMNNNSNRDIALTGQEMTLRHCLWNTEIVSGGASLSVASVGNRSGDPGLDGALHPIEPISQLINNAFSGFTLPVSADYDGGPRVVGSRGDIGAYESAVNDAATLVVTNTNDSGVGSLRQAIIDANTNPAQNTIEFNIPGSCPRLINLLSSLPDVLDPVTIDGYTQPGSATNESASGFDGSVCVFLLGGNERANGLALRPADTGDLITAQGLGFYGFRASGVFVMGNGRAVIRGNLFGTGANVANQPFENEAIEVRDASGTIIGGPDLASRNVIGLAQVGVLLRDGGARRTVQNNLIGVDRNGTAALANEVGVKVINSDDDMILKNTIAFNNAQGVLIAPGGSLAIRIESNKIGTTTASPLLGGNGSNGVRIEDGDGHRVFGNKIWNNGTDGVALLSTSRRNLLASNTYFNNALQAIDLSPDGVNPIDLDVGQTGANDQQNYPTIQTARGSNTQGDVNLLLSTANGSYSVQLLLSADCSSPFSQGQYLLAGTVAPIAVGCAGPTVNCPQPITLQVAAPAAGIDLIGAGITAIAWDEQNNTSEVSACVLYQQGPLLLRDGFE